MHRGPFLGVEARGGGGGGEGEGDQQTTAGEDCKGRGCYEANFMISACHENVLVSIH